MGATAESEVTSGIGTAKIELIGRWPEHCGIAIGRPKTCQHERACRHVASTDLNRFKGDPSRDLHGRVVPKKLINRRCLNRWVIT